MGKRTLKREKTLKNELKLTETMIQFLENKWKNKVCYTCRNCLIRAYDSEMNNTTGYVTDEDLIESSNKKLKHL